MMIWAIGGGTGVLGLLGLLTTAHAGDGGARSMGMALFVFCVLFILLLIKDAYDRAEGYGLTPERVAHHDAQWAALRAANGTWLLGGAATALGIAGLLGASHAHGAGQTMGILLFAFAVLLDFLLIKHTFDKAERA